MIPQTVSQEVEKNKSWLVRVGVAAALVGVLAISGTVIWSAVSAGLGLLALGAVALVGLGLVQLTPYLGQKLENKVLSLRKKEARQNPIEQLQNYFRFKAEQLQAFKTAVLAIGAQIKSLEDRVDARQRQKPDADLSKQRATITAMKTAHTSLVKKYNDADNSLKELKDHIEDKKFAWDFATAGQAAMQALNSTSGEELLTEMLADEASKSVLDNFNSVFSALELEAARINSSDQLKIEGTSETLDVSKIVIPKFEKVVSS